MVFVATAFTQCCNDGWWYSWWLDPLGVHDSLRGGWDMDSLTATCDIYDFSGNGNNGVITGATDTTGFGEDSMGCASGGSYYFDGTNYVNCGNDPSLQIKTKITASAWIYSTSTRYNGYYILAKRSYRVENYYLCMEQGSINITKVYWGNNDHIMSCNDHQKNRWEFVGFRANQDTIFLYHNGAWVDTTIHSASWSASYNVPLWIGSPDPISYGNLYNWRGFLDEIRIIESDDPAIMDSLYYYNDVHGACAAAPVTTGAKMRGVSIDGKLQTWRTQ